MIPAGVQRASTDRTAVLSAASLRSVLDQLSLAIFIFRGERLVYTNPPATRKPLGSSSTLVLVITSVALGSRKSAR